MLEDKMDREEKTAWKCKQSANNQISLSVDLI